MYDQTNMFMRTQTSETENDTPLLHLSSVSNPPRKKLKKERKQKRK